jgi:hypothetical protein
MHRRYPHGPAGTTLQRLDEPGGFEPNRSLTALTIFNAGLTEFNAPSGSTE